MKISALLAFCLSLVACTVAPKPLPPGGIDFDAQTGKQDGGLIDFYEVNGVVWTNTSDDWRNEYVNLYQRYGAYLTNPPKDENEGWVLTPPIACNPGVRETMKQLRVFQRPQPEP